jgi:glutathione S-transferase
MSQATLYSFRRCPYAMRARMALRYSAIALDIVEVSLKAKPAEMLALSSKGTVPVLHVDGRVIDESLEIMRWALDQRDPQDWRLADDPEGQRLTAELIEENDQVFKPHLNRYKYPERHPEQPMEHYRSEGEAFLRKLEERLQARPFLVAAHLSLADVRQYCRSCASLPMSIASGLPRRPTLGYRTGCRACSIQSCSRRSWPSKLYSFCGEGACSR